jgi:hypothetical protein
MKRFLTILAVAMLAVAPAAMAQPTSFGWTVSNSTVTALSNVGPIAPGPSMFAGNLYLWLYCGTPAGMAAAEFDVVELRGGGAPTGFTPMNGFLNAGTATAMLLAVGGCPTGPVLAGSFSVGPDAFLPDIEICLVPSVANNRNITVECGTGLGVGNLVQGFAKTSPASCSVADLCPTSVEENTWGSIKGLYR